jgi:hypothetical protein
MDGVVPNGIATGVAPSTPRDEIDETRSTVSV